MRIAILRRARGVSFSMDVHADGLVKGLKTVRPDWEIIEIAPKPWWKGQSSSWKAGSGLKKYYERYWHHPRAASKQNVDLFHIIDHSNAHLAYWLKKTGKPVVITCHDLVQLVYPEILRDQSRFPALSMAMWKYSANGLKQADRIVSVSTNTAQDISHLLNIKPTKISVIPNAVDPAFPKLQNKFTQTVHSPIRLLNVGSTHHRKNILTILQVLKRLTAQGQTAVLWRVGAGFTGEQEKFIRDQQLANSIVDLGTPDQQKLIEIYSTADFLIAPSLYEGFGLTILEAMACGLPVITSNVSSLPEVVDNAAIMKDPTDADGIAASVIALSKDKEKRDYYIQAGLARVKQFSREKTAEDTAQLYEEQCKQSQSKRLSFIR